ncbi:MAG: threonine--tRNA ligase [Anaerolineae bacterium]
MADEQEVRAAEEAADEADEAAVEKAQAESREVADDEAQRATVEQTIADELHRIRHSTAHVMAQAVVERFPEAKVGIGPPIQDGFYYDFDLGTDEGGRSRTFSPEDLEAIEERMREIVKGKHAFEVREVTAEEAEERFADEPYKLELIRELAAGNVDEYGEPVDEPVPITLYQQDRFTDLCRGPHVPNTGYIKPNAFKLLSTAAAYWRGDEHRPMLQRIYGTAWKNKTSLEEFLARLEEIEKRDHRRIGTDLDLYSTSPEQVGGGLVLWHPKGGLMRHLIEEYAKERHLEGGYDFVYTPHIGRGQLWETSGHLDFFRENMYAPLDIDGQEYFLKPMNCPFHIMIYKSRRRSYRELPIKMAEWGTVYRYERSGVLHGLMRVRGFTQDDAHIFCAPDDVDESIAEVLNFSLDILEAFGFEDFAVYVSTMPDKAVGDVADWDRATQALIRAVEARGLDYEIKEGEGAFYGPKIDIDIQDALGRAWQCSTIQFDFNLPEKFGLTYADADGELRRPYMVHRALFGSMERFFGVLVEHYGGAFPVWLSPVQAVVIPIADRHLEYAESVAERLREAGIRVEVDGRDDRMRAKIRDAQLAKVPYMLVVGDREAENDAVAVRLRTEADLGAESVDDFIARIKDAIEARTGVEGE